MGISINDLSPWARRKALKKYQEEQEKEQKRAAVPKLEDAFDSQLERDYYLAEILPRVRSGEISTVSLHEQFEILPASSYCGIRLPAAHYTPDFVVTYADGTIEVVEVKSKQIRRMQGSYVYRRRLFIDRYARPNRWKFTEVIR